MFESTLSTVFETYNFTLWGMWLIFVTIVAQAMIATVAHRKQTQYVPGIVDDKLSHESFVFRSHRTIQNSLENIVQFIVPAILAMLVGANEGWLSGLVWTYAIARLIHMVLYYAIATEKNPSPRSYFYIIGLFANIGVLVLLASALAA